MDTGAGGDGWPADVVFDGAQHGYSYDDIVFMPGHVMFEPREADLSARLTRNIVLKLPFVGGPSDAVTEAEMAIELALAGGIGFIHCNQSTQSQVEMLKRVKRHHNGFIYEPVTLSPDHTVADVDRVKAAYGFSGLPITDDGELGGRILGIVTSRDIDPVEDRSVRLEDVMTKDVVLGNEGLTLAEAYDLMQKRKVSKLPIVNTEMRLTSMVSRSDLKKTASLRDATRDSASRLMVGAAVCIDGQSDWDRTLGVIEAGADVIYIDTTGGNSGYELNFISKLKAEYPHIDVVAGPVTACREAKFLCDAGVDGVVVGSCATSLGIGGECNNFGRPEATATFEIARYVSLNYGLPCLAQGGLRNPGQILKALGLGASAVILDDLLAAVLQAPSCERDGASVRLIPAGQSVAAVQCGQARHDSNQSAKLVDQNANTAVMGKGSVRALIPYVASGLRNGMCDLGIRTTPDLHQALMEGTLRMECRSFFGQKQAESRALAAQRSPQQYIQPVRS